jgi:hypothetical protein
MTGVGPADGSIGEIHVYVVTGPEQLLAENIIIWIPLSSVELVTQTFKETVEDSAINLMNELFSNEPQKAVPNSGQKSAVYDAEVFPQYPFTSHIAVATEQSLPAGSELAQEGISTGAETQIENVGVVGFVAAKW